MSSTGDDVRSHVPSAGHAALWWLGQSGFVLKSAGGTTLVIDPYLSNSCREIGEQYDVRMDRIVPSPIEPRELAGVDAFLITHTHQDHLDPQTIDPYRAAGGAGPFLAPAESAERLAQLDVPQKQIVQVWPNKVTTIGDCTIRTTFAIPGGPDDLTHVGYLVAMREGPTVYFTGDTAYHELLSAAAAPHRPDVLACVINGAFRNMSAAEAARLAKELDVKCVIPCHHDLFPDNSLPPRMLRTCLLGLGLADRYRELKHGERFTFPE